MEESFDLRAILGLLRRHLRLIVTTIVVAVALAGVVVFTLKPLYTASTLIFVDPSRKDLLNPDDTSPNASSDSARVESEVELVKSESTLLRAISDLNLISDPEFGVKLGFKDTVMAFLRISQPVLPTGDAALQTVIRNLRDAVTVERKGLTYLISINARSLQPANAARIANAIADAYIKEQLQAKIDSTLASRDIIQARIADASTTVSKSEASFDDFIASNLNQISAETGRTDLLDLRSQLDALNTKRSEAAAVAQLAEASLARQDWDAVANSLKSEAIAKLESDRKALQQSLTIAAEGSAQAIDLKAELGKLDTQLTNAATAELTSLRQDVTTSQAQASQLRDQLRSTVLGTNLPPDVLTSIYGLQQNAELARTQYQTLLGRLRDLDAQAYLQVADSRIASQALAPNTPSFPNPPLILGLAFVFGVGLAVALAFLLENFIGGFTSAEQVESVLHTKVVATAPRERVPKGKGGGDAQSVAEYVTQAPLSLFAEAIRRIRIGCEQAVRRHRDPDAPESARGTVIMVTSAAPNEGKTTIAVSLARAYALSGRSTLLIDCDLRKPSIHRQLEIEPSNGLIEFLSNGRTDSTPFLADDTSSGARIIVGSHRSDVPTDQLVSGKAFRQLIATSREKFDIVILDTPPIGPVVDGLYLAPLADVIAFVVRWTSTSQQEARAAVAALEESMRPDTDIIAVLNQQEGGRARYNYRYAGYYAERRV